MFFDNLSKGFFIYLKLLVVLTLLLPVHGISGSFAQEDVTVQNLVQVEHGRPIDRNDPGLIDVVDPNFHIDVASLENTFDTSLFSPPSPDPTGIAYIGQKNTLLISDSEVDEMPMYFTGDNLFEVSLDGSLQDTLTTIAFSGEPTGVTYNPANGHLFFSDASRRRVYELNPGPDGLYNTSDDVVTWFRTEPFGSVDPQGVTFDSWWGVLFIVDSVNAEVYRVSPGSNGVFDGVSPDGDDEATSFDITHTGVNDPEGIAFNPDTGNLFIAGNSDFVVEMTTDGTVIRLIDISAASPLRPSGIAYAPGSSNPSEMHLYIADRGVDNDDDPNENDGKVYEFSFPPFVNLPPEVDAGPDATIILPNSAVLNGTVTDLTPTEVLTSTWSKTSGAGAVVFGDASMEDTTASFSTAGTYILRLTAGDGELTSWDEVEITVHPVNQPPVVDAGSDQTVTFAAGATLDGTVIDDGYPIPPGMLTITWSKIDGSGDVVFGDACMEDTTASFSEVGTYVLRLTASDSALTVSDDVTITVIASSINDPPTISGTVAGQTVDDVDTIDPFMTVTISDPDTATITVTVSLDNPAKGDLVNLAGFVEGPPGIYTFTGSSAEATTNIQALTFDPTEDRVPVGQDETTTFTISADDGIADPVSDDTTTVIVTVVDKTKKIFLPLILR